MAGPLARLVRHLAPRTPDAETREPRLGDGDADLARAARLLEVRTRREATGVFAGAYASAFRGGGMEFHESQPYVPGDDVRSLDWNAMARTGEPFVKRFREERDQTLLIGLDTSASMGFGAVGEPKHRVATRAAALLAAAAGRAGDRVGLVAFADVVGPSLRAGRGAAHTWQVIRAAARAGSRPAGPTRLDIGLEALRRSADVRGVCVLLSDFRDGDATPEGPSRFATSLATLARRHDVLSIVLFDPRETSLPRAGLVRLEDPERPGRTRVLDTGRAAVRARYRRAWAIRSRSLERSLRAGGSDVLWMRTDRDPLGSLTHYFQQRAAGAGGPRR